MSLDQVCPLCKGNVHRNKDQVTVYHKPDCLAVKHMGWATEIDVVLTAAKQMYMALQMVPHFGGIRLLDDSNRCIGCGVSRNLGEKEFPHEKECEAQQVLAFVKQATQLILKFRRFGGSA